MSTRSSASLPTAKTPVTQETNDACTFCVFLFLGTIAVLLAEVCL